MEPRLVLWDIDGTLMRSGGAGGDALTAAVEEVLGRRGGWVVERRGRTDRFILTELMTAAGVPSDDQRPLLPVVMARSEEILRANIERISTEGWVCAGVESVLDELSRLPHVTQSVLTGNSEANARTKLTAFGLDQFIDLGRGAFGSGHNDRADLVTHALQRHDHRFEGRQTWIVGDTPHDLACARAGGTRCLLVATGQFDYQELAHLGSEVVLPNLLDTQQVVELLSGVVEG